MNVEIEKSTAKGSVIAPPSKSFLHRMIICASLADGTSTIHNVSDSQDILATLDCAESLYGIKYTKSGSDILIHGNGAHAKGNGKLYCRESGSTLRFFIPLCLTKAEKTEAYGSERLLSRPLDVYENICREQGLTFVSKEDHIELCGKLRSGEFVVPGNISSQFISGLMFALPLLDGDSKIIITKPIESIPYINMTVDVLRLFGIDVEFVDGVVYIKGNQNYMPANVAAEGDCSNAAFLDAFNLIGGDVNVLGLNPNTAQGDSVYSEYFSKLGTGEELDVSDCPDLAPVLMAMASVCGGATLVGTKRLEIKESNRGLAMKEELEKFGVPVHLEENSIVVGSGAVHKPVEPLYGHNDHRIVMSLAVLASVTGGVIRGAEAVNKSFTDFFDKIVSLGIKVKRIDD